MDPEIQEVPLSRPDVVVLDDDPHPHDVTHLSSPPPPHPNAPPSNPTATNPNPAATTTTTTTSATNPLVSNLQPAAHLPSSGTDPLENLEKALESASETLSSLATTVIHFSYDSQDLIFAKVNEFVKDLRAIDSVSHSINADIPFEIIETIDKGRNPEQCTYQMLESCAEANNHARGKLAVIRGLRNAMEAAATDADGKSGAKDGGGVSVGNVVTNGF